MSYYRKEVTWILITSSHSELNKLESTSAIMGNRKALTISTCAISAAITKHEKGYQSCHNPCHCSHHERTTEYSQENANRLEKCCSIKSMGIFACWLVGNYRSRKREHNDKLEVASEEIFSVTTLLELQGDNPMLKAYVSFRPTCALGPWANVSNGYQSS